MLREKLKEIGVAGGLNNNLENYLEQRKQYVVVGDQRSEMPEVKFGVPQESLVGPRIQSLALSFDSFLVLATSLAVRALAYCDAEHASRSTSNQ